MTYPKKVKLAFLFIYFSFLGSIILFWYAKNAGSIEIYSAPKEAPMAPPAVSAASPGSGVWVVPPHWKEQKASGMRAGSFLIQTEGKEDVDVSVVILGGEAGGILGNVNRWLGQIGEAAVDEKGLSSLVKKIQDEKGPLDVVELKGANQAIFAVIRPLGDQTIFFKMIGPSPLVAKESQGLIKMARESGFE